MGKPSGKSLERPAVIARFSGQPAVPRDDRWLRGARRVRWLSCLSLGWMVAEAVVGVLAGAEAHSIGVIAWAFGSGLEAGAAVIVLVRFSGRNRFSDTAERRAQKWVAASFLLLVPYIVYGAVDRLLNGGQPDLTWLAIGLLGSSVVLMPVLGWSKRRLGKRLASGATAGEGTQNWLCAGQGAIALVGLVLGSASAWFVDPLAALLIVAIAAREGVELWHGDRCGPPDGSSVSAPRFGDRADVTSGRFR